MQSLQNTKSEAKSLSSRAIDAMKPGDKIKVDTGENTGLWVKCNGDHYLRSLLVHGARSVVSRVERKEDRPSLWIIKIKVEREFNKAVVALANKRARMGWWAILHNQTTYHAV